MSSASSSYESQNKNLVSFLWEVGRAIQKTLRVTCHIEGYLLFCEPCVRHGAGDSIVFDIMAPEPPYFWFCTKEPWVRGDTYVKFDEEQEKQIEKLRRSIRSREVESTRAIIVEKNYLLQGVYLSTRGGREGHTLYKYYPEKGYYKSENSGAVKHDLQILYEKIFREKPPVYLVPQMFAKITEAVERTDDDLFSPVRGNVLYISGKSNDLEVDKATSEMRVVPKDPLNRPFLSALPYDFIDTFDEMPPELREIMKLVPPQFQNILLYELVSPLAFQPRHLIFVNYSRTSNTGKSTLFRRMYELYGGEDGGLLTTSDISLLGERFERSDYRGRGALLIDETEDLRRSKSLTAFLKKIASGSVLRVEEKYGEKTMILNRLVLIMNTNRITFPPDRTLLSRFAVIPFIHTFESRKVVPEWSQSTRQYIVNWLIRYVLPRYLRADETEMVMYDEDKLIAWTRKGYPASLVEDFLKAYFHRDYPGTERHGKLVTLDQAYHYYVNRYVKETIPVTDKEFKEKVQKIADEEKGYIVEEKGQKMLYMRVKGLEPYMVDL